MNHQVIFTKTLAGDEAVRQSTRVVQRNLRMVLVQVDGKLTVGDLAGKIGNLRLVESALAELEADGLIAPTTEATAWHTEEIATSDNAEQVSALSQFSTFGAKPDSGKIADVSRAPISTPSSFGRSILPSSVKPPQASPENAENDYPPEPIKKRTSLARLAKGGLIFLLAVMVVALFYPYDSFKPRIEAAASRFLGMPVEVGEVSLAFSPLPRLQLDNVRLSNANSSIAKLTLSSPHKLLWGSRPDFQEITVTGGVFSAAGLVDLPMFSDTKTGRGVSEMSIRQIRLEDCEVGVGGIGLKDIDGEIFVGADGKLEKGEIQAFERSLKLGLLPAGNGIALKIESSHWKPAGTAFSFGTLQAKGLLMREKLLVQDVDMVFLGGLVQGNWLLDWSKGLAMAGDATLSRLDAKRVAATFAPAMQLEGEFGGNLRMRGAGNDWDTMWRSLEANLDVDIGRGVIGGIDLGEAARRGQGAIVRSGVSKFDRLRGHLLIRRSQLSGRDLVLDSGMMSATGQFVANSDKQIDGIMTVAIKTSVSSFLVPVRISGALPELTASVGK